MIESDSQPNTKKKIQVSRTSGRFFQLLGVHQGMPGSKDAECRLTAEVEETKEDARQMAILAREESVAPLKAELEQIKASVEASCEAYTADLARVSGHKAGMTSCINCGAADSCVNILAYLNGTSCTDLECSVTLLNFQVI